MKLVQLPGTGGKFEILENHAPVPAKEMENYYADGPQKSHDFLCDGLFVDPDGESLSDFSYELVGDAVVSVFPSSGKIHVVTTKPGFCQLKVIVSDALGAQGSVSIGIFVKNPSEQVVYSYPNPVTDVLNVRIDAKKANTLVEVVNAAGGKVYEEEIADASCFEPIVLALGKLAPGRYVLRVTCNGGTASRTFVKI